MPSQSALPPSTPFPRLPHPTPTPPPSLRPVPCPLPSSLPHSSPTRPRPLSSDLTRASRPPSSPSDRLRPPTRTFPTRSSPAERFRKITRVRTAMSRPGLTTGALEAPRVWRRLRLIRIPTRLNYSHRLLDPVRRIRSSSLCPRTIATTRRLPQRYVGGTHLPRLPATPPRPRRRRRPP
jgi:hypothetical protein